MNLNEVEESDGALVTRYLNGEADALETLVNRHKIRMYTFILNMTRSREEAEDVFQEVWLRVIKNIGGYREKNLAAWLMRIAHNLVIDRWRTRKETVSIDAEGGESIASLERSAPESSPAENAAEREITARVAAAINELPAEQREVVLLRLELDMPFKEIAAIQRVSIGTALARMQYRLSKLRRVLRQEYSALKEDA